MKNPIYKRIARQIISSPGRNLPLFLAMIFIVVFASSFFISQDSVKKLYYKQLNEGKIEDGQFTTIQPLSDTLKNKLEDENVKIYECFNMELSSGQGKKLKAFKKRNDINKEQVLKGRLPEQFGEVALSGNYARANGIRVQDTIQLEGTSWLVTGLVSLPDYSSLLRNRDDLVMDTGYYGICLLNEKGFDSFLNIPHNYTYAYRTKEDLDKKQSRDQLKTLVKKINQENMTLDGVIRQDNHCITYIMDDMEGDVPTMMTAMVILFIALAFISAVQMKSLVEKEAPVIGTLLASGYMKKELLGTYMLTPLILSLGACVVGNIIAYSFAYKKYVSFYYQSFDLPNFQLTLNLRSFLLTCIIPLSICLVVNYLVISRSLQITPLNFLRGSLRKEKKKSKINLSPFSFLTKCRIRLLLDNKLNVSALLLGIFLSNLLLIFGLSVKPIFYQYAQNMKDTMQYNYTYLVKAEEKDLRAEKATILPVELVDKDDKKVQIYGVDKTSKYQIKGWDSLNEDELVVSRGFVKRFSYKIGDRIDIREPYNNEVISLHIKSIADENSLFQLFTRREYLNKIVDKNPEYLNAYFSDQNLRLPTENIVTVVDKQDMTKFMEHFLDGFGVVFDMLFYMGVGFSMIVTAIVIGLIVEKSRVSISYLKILGFKDQEISRIYVYGVLLLIVIFQFLIIPVLKPIMQWLIFVSMAKLDAYIIADIPLFTSLKAIGVSFIVFICIQIVEHIKLSGLNMVKELKISNG